MNGAADMGGMHGFGPVQPETDEPIFHAAWEKRAFALTMAMAAAGRWSMDELLPDAFTATSFEAVARAQK